MIIHGKNYKKVNPSVVPASIQQFKRRLGAKRETNCKTADDGQNMPMSYSSYINDSSQIQLSQ